MNPRIVFLLLAALGLFACGDPMSAPGPDAMSLADAGPPDALSIDAPPPWEPSEPVIPGEPCEIVSEVHEPMYDARMANYAVRFKDGQGLEASPDIRQTGSLVVQDAHIDNREVVEKRRGVDVLADSRSSTPDDDVPLADRRAIWTRGDETLLQTHDRLYSEKLTSDDFQWREVGAWTQMRLREAYAGAFDTEVLNADSAYIGGAQVVAYQLDGSDVEAAIYSEVGAREVLQSFATSENPRLSHEGDRVRLTYRDTSSNALFSDRYSSGDTGFSPIDTTVAVPANRQWDVHSARLANGSTERVTAYVANAPNADDVTVSVSIEGIVIGTLTTTTAGATHTDVAVSVWPRRVGSNIRVGVVWATATAGVWSVHMHVVDFHSITGAVAADAGHTATLPDSGSSVGAVALSWEDSDTIWFGVDQTSAPQRKVTYFSHLRNSGTILQDITHEATSLVHQGAIISGTPTDTLVSAGAEPLSPAFGEVLLGEEALDRSGWIIYAPRSREVIARSMVAYTGDLSTRNARPVKGSLIVNDNDTVSWGGAVRGLSDPGNVPSIAAGTVELKSVAACYLDRTQHPNAPAFADGTSVSAHAGYPRAYDGTNVFEHDWHSIPHIIDVTESGTGSYTGGDIYQIAATWEHDDANGVRYRSAPSFFEYTIVGGPGSLDVEVEGLTHSERPSARLVLWRTIGNGATLHRQIDVPVTGVTQIEGMAASTDTFILSKEVLDQAPVPLGQGLIATSRPARVTDFVSWVGERLMSRDPLKGSLARFSIPSREANGYAMHWPLAFAVEEPDEREITAALELDGRTVLGSRLGLGLLNGDGPDATGAGSYGQPVILRAEIGIADQTQVARTPIGYVFGSIHGPRLLTPGLTVEQLDRPVERKFKIDGDEIAAVAYDQNRDEVIWLSPDTVNTDRTLRFSTSTGRWASNTNYTGRDLTVTKSGTVYLIRHDGKVLKQREDVYADGETGYALTVSTPWIRDQTRDGTTHSNFRIESFHVSGEYVGPHALYFDLYKDFDDSAPFATYEVTSQAVADNQAAGRPWIYGVRVGGSNSYLACRIAVRDGSELTASFRLAQMDVDILTDKNSAYVELPREQYAQKV